jgi:hypothetical protein
VIEYLLEESRINKELRRGNLPNFTVKRLQIRPISASLFRQRDAKESGGKVISCVSGLLGSTAL